jgi:hypothetical protein
MEITLKHLEEYKLPDEVFEQKTRFDTRNSWDSLNIRYNKHYTVVQFLEVR